MNVSESTRSAEDAFTALLRRARAEYLEMPGLQLTAAQAARLWALDAGVCSDVLASLVESRFLVRNKTSQFARVS
jgi:hypothetical protein